MTKGARRAAVRTAMIAVAASVAATLAAPASPPPPDRQVANVVAFARLYGVMRYFYPSDTAASIDWDRLAIVGVGRVRNAPDTARLREALEALFQPLGPGIEIGATLSRATEAPADGPLVAWRYLGPGFAGGPYAGKRTHRAADIDGFVTMMQKRPAEALRGQTVRLRARVRASVRNASGGGALWLRVDRPDNGRGFFDNMGDRPVRDAEWREYTVEGPVAEDASSLAFGVMSSGGVTADFDALELSVRGSSGEWAPVAVEDAGFEADASARGWQRAGTSKTAVVSRPSIGAPEGRQFLRLGPSSEDAELFAESPPAPGAHVDIDLGSGLKARVPLALTDAQARASETRPSGLEALTRALASGSSSGEGLDLDTRFADVVVAWNVFRHFYPYWAETGVRWDDRLEPNLRAAKAAETRAAQADALRVLVSEAEDGHGRVLDPLLREQRSVLPVGLGVVEGHLAITSSAVAEAPVGAIVSAVGGAPARRALADAERLASGTAQWREVRALWALTSGPEGADVRLTIDDGSGPRDVTLRCAGETPPLEKRPDPIVELASGLWYADLTRATAAQLTPRLPALASARGIVFDLRGYPTDAGAMILPHLIERPETDRWMHVARLVAPFAEPAGWQDFGWDIRPAEPRLAGRRVFMTDARAISYGESVMGYVADRKLATIVGRNTAGTNGNVASFLVPSGLRISFTGMRVTGHDGRSPFHLVGVKPDVLVAPTIAGLRRGRDEVLERALAVIDAAP